MTFVSFSSDISDNLLSYLLSYLHRGTVFFFCRNVHLSIHDTYTIATVWRGLRRICLLEQISSFSFSLGVRFLSANPKTDFDPRFSGFCSRKEREIRNWICNLVTFCKRVQSYMAACQEVTFFPLFTNYTITPCRILWSAVRIATMEHLSDRKGFPCLHSLI